MNTSILPWHKPFFAQWHAQQNLPHACLILSPENSGGEELLHYLAASVLCETPTSDHSPCGTCASCHLISAYSHPDLRIIRPSILDINHPIEELRPEKPSKQITVDDIRKLTNMVNQTSHRGGARVVLIYPAHKLNLNAANALLKTLEEPPPHTLFLLLAHDIKQLLPTIVSRCQRMSLPRPSAPEAIDYLNAQHGTNPNWVHYLAQENGAVQRVSKMYSTDYFNLQDSFINELAQGKDMNALKLAEQFDKHIKDADKARLAGEPLTIDMSILLTWLQRWLHDSLISALRVGQPRYYTTHAKTLTQLTVNVSRTFETRVHAWQQQLLEEQRKSEYPLNIRTWLEKLLLQYTQLF